MQSETRNCQNCKKDFTIESDDLGFYEKMDVLPPKICPDCRSQLRLSFRNERCFYKRACDRCKKSVVSMYSESKKFPVWCYDCWFSDDWDVMDYAKDFDSLKSFWEQVSDLLNLVPKIAMVYVRSPGSQYINISADNKNCYMIVESSNNEDCINCYWIQQSRDLVDCSFTNKVDLSYEVVDCYDSNNLKWSKGCHNCLNSAFLLDCRNCSDCLGCFGLRGQQYDIFNKQYTKEEYQEKVKLLRLDTYSGLEQFKNDYKDFLKDKPRKYADITQSTNSTGNYIKNAKSCRSCFHCYESEDCKYGVHTWRNAKDCMDVDTAGRNAELIYNSINSGLDTSNQVVCNLCWSSTNASYSSYCFNSNNVLGCVGLRKKNYCILNKQYSKDEYEKLSEKIKKEIKAKGEWGDFFTKDMSAFGYNETVAFEQFPMTKEDALKQGFKWEDTHRGTYGQETVNWDNFPDSINDLPKDFGEKKEVFKCLECSKNFRIINNELIFYKRMEISLPRTCPECRHMRRVKDRGPNKLWPRQCMCEKENHADHKGKCQVKFETSYAPDRPEIIYCEKCYQQEVY